MADDAVDGVFGDDVAEGAAAFDGEGGHGDGEGEVAEVEGGFEDDGEVLGVAFGLGGVFLEVEDAGAGGALGDGVGFVAGDAPHAEAFGVGAAGAAVAVDDGVDGFVVFFEELEKEGVFTDEEFRDDFGDSDVAFRGEVDDVVEGGALEEGLAFAFQAVAGEAVLGVEVEGLVGHDDLRGGDAVEGGDFGAAFLAWAVGFFEALEMGDGEAGELLQMAFDFGDVFFESGDVFVSLEGVELGDAFDADLGEAGDVVVGDFAFEEFQVRFEAFPDGGDDGLPGGAFFDVAIDAFFDEDLLEGGEVPFFFEFAEFDLEFLT